MTSFSFEDRYQLLKCVAVSDGIRTHNALEVVTGRVVMVHLLDAAGPEDVERLRAQLARLPQSDKVRILETATLPAGFALVSEFLQGLTTFPDWLAARVMPELPIDASGVGGPAIERGAHVKAEETTKPPGDFTRLFGALPQAASVAEPPASQAEAKPPERTYPGNAPLDTPVSKGEAAPTASPRVVPPQATPPPVAPPVAASPLVPPPMSASPLLAPPVVTPPTFAPLPVAPPPVVPPPSATAPPAASPLAPGEFTKFFQPPIARPSGDVAPSPFTGSPASGDAARRGGSRSADAPPGMRDPRVPSVSPFGAPPGASPLSTFGASPAATPDLRPTYSPPPAPPASAAQGGTGAPPHGSAPLRLSPLDSSPPGASPLASSPLGLSSSSPRSLPPVLPPPVFGASSPGSPRSPVGAGGAGGSDAPGEYTQLIHQSVTPQPPAPAPAKPAPAPPASRKRSIPLGLIIALNVVLLLTAVLVVYFVFRTPPPVAVPGATIPAAPTAPAVPPVPKAELPGGAAPRD